MINLKNWKKYKSIKTNSLWIIDKRDNSGELEKGKDYPGNYCPQIPEQFIKRFTKKGDWILDPFAGSFTTGIVANKLKRHFCGIDLKEFTGFKGNYDYKCLICRGDSRDEESYNFLKSYTDKVQLIMLHPPYFNIIKYSKEKEDLSNYKDVNIFRKHFLEIVDNCEQFLEDGKFMVLVIGDFYKNKEWFPLGFYMMQDILNTKKFILKSIIVKNFGETKAKGKNSNLWRYRALKGDFYVFKHENIFLFQKKG
jgi:DNA modification methylase